MVPIDYLEEKWPGRDIGSDKSIRRRMTQKCTDAYNDVRNIHLRHTSNAV